MANYKRKKPRFNKLYRNGTDGVGCGYCGSNWIYKNWMKSSGTYIRYEFMAMGDGTEW